ncbi:hypothetical protein MTBMA_c07340 [Methanothermobacter marburgensis str. Marburg]|uniref:Uncharacterized protein n=1 Tax=Methanothermobacter marburgensis (strain ATCC BAA-927 / DSM 2133 / JCM 14651 / NBRC 100331 / OCM 82 / Marburg) TaxID=79929 RepID=D9PVT1_METTM|nr:hypothetical protein MTBMA_c07340 [Methanothermobacter marburgensis str. Marburg]
MCSFPSCEEQGEKEGYRQAHEEQNSNCTAACRDIPYLLRNRHSYTPPSSNFLGNWRFMKPSDFIVLRLSNF